MIAWFKRQRRYARLYGGLLTGGRYHFCWDRDHFSGELSLQKRPGTPSVWAKHYESFNRDYREFVEQYGILTLVRAGLPERQIPYLATLYRGQFAWLSDDLTPQERLLITAQRAELEGIC